MKSGMEIAIALALIALSHCPVAQSQQIETPTLSQGENTVPELTVVNNHAALVGLSGQRVKLLGRYVARSHIPEFPGIPDRYIPHWRAKLVLVDGTEVAIFSSWDKKSLRSPEEVEDYQGQRVEAIGTLHIAPDNSDEPDPIWISLEHLQLHESKHE